VWFAKLSSQSRCCRSITAGEEMHRRDAVPVFGRNAQMLMSVGEVSFMLPEAGEPA
jgi:hypothetical protein